MVILATLCKDLRCIHTDTFSLHFRLYLKFTLDAHFWGLLWLSIRDSFWDNKIPGVMERCKLSKSLKFLPCKRDLKSEAGGGTSFIREGVWYFSRFGLKTHIDFGSEKCVWSDWSAPVSQNPRNYFGTGKLIH